MFSKKHCFEGWSWFAFNKLGLVLDMVAKCYSSAVGDKGVGRLPPLSWLGLTQDCISEMNGYKLFQKLFMER